MPQLGSVCSGGRYDNLAGLYTKQQLPGIGASLGLDRLFAGLEELGMVDKVSSPVKVFIPMFDSALCNEYFRLARTLREGGIGVEIYPEAKKLGQQIKYADKKGISFALVLGTTELEKKTVQVKDLKASTQEEISFDELVDWLKKRI